MLVNPSPYLYKLGEELRMCRRPLASGHHYGQVPNRRRALMIRIHAAYTLCPPTPALLIRLERQGAYIRQLSPF